MDYELWLQLMFRAGTDGVWVDPRPLSVFRLHPVSKTSTVHHRFLDEIASMLHGLAIATAQPELASVLAKGHAISEGLRGIPVGPTSAAMVRRMVIWFLLRWHHTIYSESDLRMMKAFRSEVPLNERSLNAQQKAWLAEIDASIDVPGWWAFRLRRKWTHLRNK
jgi:hypothetical protein